MATEWLEADLGALRRLAWILDQTYRGEITAALATEARKIEDAFGLSPYGRRRLLWTIAEGEVVEHPTVQGQRRLRAVDGAEGR